MSAPFNDGHCPKKGHTVNITDDIVNEVKHLSEPLQREVLNFAHFLKQKAAEGGSDNLMHAQHTSMEHIWNNEEDEVWNDMPTR